MKQEGLRNIRPDQAPRRKKGRKGRLTRLLHLGSMWAAMAPSGLLVLLGLLGGCGTDPTSLLPRVDPLANLPDNRQTKVLPSNSVTPVSGPTGTVISVQGQGNLFPAGFAHFTFHGSATSDVEVPNATGLIRVRVPPGAQSGAFGFTIAGRPAGRDTSAQRPSDTNEFIAYTVEDPGFSVTPPVVLTGPQNQQPGGATTNLFGN